MISILKCSLQRKGSIKIIFGCAAQCELRLRGQIDAWSTASLLFLGIHSRMFGREKLNRQRMWLFVELERNKYVKEKTAVPLLVLLLGIRHYILARK